MESDLAVSGALAWLRLLLGSLLFLAPGVALADRLFTKKTYLVLAPVFSFSVLPLVAILLDFALGVPINALTTALIAAAAAAWAGWPRLRQWTTRLAGGTHAD